MDRDERRAKMQEWVSQHRAKQKAYLAEHPEEYNEAVALYHAYDEARKAVADAKDKMEFFNQELALKLAEVVYDLHMGDKVEIRHPNRVVRGVVWEINGGLNYFTETPTFSLNFVKLRALKKDGTVGSREETLHLHNINWSKIEG